MATSTDTDDTGLKLPQDIYNCIVPFCHGNWRNLRLVNKAFEVDATKWLFQELTVCLQQRSFKRMIDISKTSNLAQHVRSICIGGEAIRPLYLPPYAFVYGLQREYFDDPQKFFGNGRDMFARSVEINYEQYQAFLRRGAFPAYPKRLEAIISSTKAFDLYRQEGDILFSNLSYQLCEQDIKDMGMVLTNLDKLSSVYIRQPEHGSWGAIRRLVMHPEDHLNSISGETYYDRRLEVLLRAATLVGKLNLSKLVVEQPRDHRDAGLLGIPNKYILLARPSLVNLAHLDIPIGKYPTWSEDEVGINFDLDMRPHLIANLVRSLPQLKSLAIRQLKGVDIRVKIWPVLAAIRPGHLKSIYLDNCIYMPSILRRFFIDHSETLEHVTMNRSYILYGTFTWVFEEMRNRLSLKSLNLYSFLVEIESSHSYYRDGWEYNADPGRDAARQAISDYVTHQTDIFPIDMIDEHAPSATSRVHGVIQFIGRQDYLYPDDVQDEFLAYDIETCRLCSQEYPDGPDAYDASERACNNLITRMELENNFRIESEEICKKYLVTQTDGMVKVEREEEFNTEIDRVRGRIPSVENCKTVFRHHGWLI